MPAFSTLRPALTAALLAVSFPAPQAGAQSADTIRFGGIKADIKAPIEVASDALTVDQATGHAIFSGNVEISQGEMHLSAASVTIRYADQDQRRIEQMEADGAVTLVSGPDAAEADHAVYHVETGEVTLTGDVLLSQGQNVMAANSIKVDLATGTARAEGRVRTILQPAD